MITNDAGIKTRALISQYARRMTIEQRLAEIIRAFSADALSSAVVLCVLAQDILSGFVSLLFWGFVNEYPAVTLRRFPGTAGTITHDGDTITITITITISRRAYSPVLRQSDLRTDTTIPWWQNRRLRFQLS